jgi:peptidoglycan/LPS O-acetylase OafA/YrhL
MVIACSIYCSYYPECKEANTAKQKILCSFDFFRNLKTLTKIDEKHDQKIRVFDGIRVGGILWVAFGHTFMIMKIGPVENISAAADYLKELSKAHVYGALFSVDIFFYLSGFLLCLVLLSSRNTKINWLLIVHRIIRLLPALLFALGLFYCILPLFGNGPLFYYYMEKVVGTCSKIWWMLYAFVYNFRDIVADSCMAWTWYASVDMQFFLISLPLMYVLIKKPKIGTYLFTCLLVVSYTVTIVVASKKQIFSSVARMTNDYLY